MFSFTCLIGFLLWSGPHATAINELRQKCVNELLVNDDLAAEYWKQLRRESTIINTINGLMFASLLLGNAGIYLLTRKHRDLTPPPISPSANIYK